MPLQGQVDYDCCMLFPLACAHIEPLGCGGAAVSDEIALTTAKRFLASQGEAGASEFEYRIIGTSAEGCRLVAAAISPDAFDSDIMITVGGRGVVRAASPSGEPFFDTRGDHAWGVNRSRPFPLTR